MQPVNEKNKIEVFIGNLKDEKLNETANPVNYVVSTIGHYFTVFTKLVPVWTVYPKGSQLQATIVFEEDGVMAISKELELDMLAVLQDNLVSAYLDERSNIVVEITTLASAYRLLCVVMRYFI